jgi:phosphoribosylglycinamide formyltransferase-1
VVPVRAGDTPQTLAARVLKQEHVIYPRAVRWFLDGKLVIEGGGVRVKGEKAGKDAQMVVAAD